MSLYVLYEAGVAAEYEDITDRFRTNLLDVTQNAEEGSVAMSTITIDDPDGDYEIKGYRRIAIYETAGIPGATELLYNGFIVDRKIIRGPYTSGAGRQWVCSVVDTNCLLEFRLMTGEDADRPAEDSDERLDWLLGESEMSRIPNHDYVNLSVSVAMDAVDYRGQRAVDVINDIAQATGMNYFAFCTDDTPSPLPDAPGKTTLWFDYADSTEYSSTLSLSNDLADVLADENCYGFTPDTDLNRDPARVYSGAYVRYDGGEVYEEDTDISNEFTRRDAVVPAENVKSSAKATARALRHLADNDVEEDRITCGVEVPAAKVNLIREGMRIPFKATHFGDLYGDFTWQRILQRKIKLLTEERYRLTLTLGTGPSWPPGPILEAGPATLYFDGDNGVTAYINGTLVGNNASGNNEWARAIPDGILVEGDNVLAFHILNGTSPASWDLGNPTAVEARLYPPVGGTPYTFTSTSAKGWMVENTAGVIGGTPANWNEASFDDSGWDNVFDSTGTSGLVSPIAPARCVSPTGVTIGMTAQGLQWLCRLNFTI